VQKYKIIANLSLIKMRIRFFLFSFGAFIFGLLTSCDNKPTESTESTISSEDLTSQADSLLSRVDIEWKEMEYADEALLSNTQQLADSIAQLEGFSQSLYDSIPLLVEEVKRQKYDQKTMSDSVQIEKFDVAMTNLIYAVERLQNTLPKPADCLLCEAVMKVIKNIDAEYVIRRKKYDQQAHIFNQFVEKNETQLQKIDAEKYQKIPVFTVPY